LDRDALPLMVPPHPLGQPSKVLSPVDIRIGDESMEVIWTSERFVGICQVGREDPPHAHRRGDHHEPHDDYARFQSRLHNRTSRDGQKQRDHQNVADADVEARHHGAY